jgi:hypothetical protein
MYEPHPNATLLAKTTLFASRSIKRCPQFRCDGRLNIAPLAKTTLFASR